MGKLHGVRWAIAAFIAAYGIIAVASSVARATSGGVIGLSGLATPREIVGVPPGSPAALAGIRAGDRIDSAATDLRSRVYLLTGGFVTAGEVVTVPLVRSGKLVPTRITATPVSMSARTLTLIGAVLQIAYAGLAVWIVLGTTRTAGLALAVAAIGGLGPAGPLSLGAATLALQAFSGVLGALGPLAILLFAVRAPDEPLQPADRRIVWAGALLTLPLIWAAIAGPAAVFFPHVPVFVGAGFLLAIPPLFIVGSVCVLAIRFARRPDLRSRLAWVIAAIVTLVPGSLNLQVTVPNAGPFLLLLGFAAFAFLGVAIVRTHLFDLRFVVSRAVVYGALTSAIVAAIALLDWFVSSVLSASRLALPLEAIAAVGIGFWLNGLHARVEAFVDRVLFRARHRAEEHLRRVAAGLDEADDARLVAPGLVQEPWTALNLGSAALFVRERDDAFVFEASRGWDADAAVRFPTTAGLMLHLAGSPGPFRIGDEVALPGAPDGDARPRVLVPIRVRQRLVAFAAYGMHRGGADVDPDEMALLALLARAAGRAYDRAQAEELRRINEELRAALAASFAAG